MVAEYKVRGVDAQQERQSKEIYRDSRRLGEKVSAWLSKPKNLGFTVSSFAIIMAVIPVLMELMLLLSAVFWLLFSGKSRKLHLPMRMPFEHPSVDYNDPFPGRTLFGTKYRKSRGIFYLGNEKSTNEELHLSADDMLTHMLLFGTTGAGKTEALLSLSWNSLSMGSGLIYIDPKGTNKLALQIFSMARIMGREDDFLLINFSTGNREIGSHTDERLSNTANPFAYGTPDSLAEILVSLIPKSEGDNAVFSERAISLIYTIMRPLVDLRNGKHINLSISAIRDHLNLEKCMELAKDPRVTEDSRRSMEAYLISVSGFKKGVPYDKQGEDAHKQFGFAQAYFTRALSSLTDTYGHVYGSGFGEVDYPDVVFNRRILVILLPAMEKPPAEIQTIGKIILTAIRGAMSLGLGSKFEGNKSEMLDSLPTASNVPNLVIADEYGYVATEGFAVTAAQARGLGFSCIFAGQDYAGFKRGSETEAEQILANTKVKIIMALEDAQATWDVVRAIGGEAYVTNTSGYTMGTDSMSSSYRDNMNVSVEKRQRVDIQDLRDQIEGEFHVFHKANMIRGQMFHANPPIEKTEYRINRFLEILRPDPEELSKRYGPVKKMTETFKRNIAKGVRVECQFPRPYMETLLSRADGLYEAICQNKDLQLPERDKFLISTILANRCYSDPKTEDEQDPAEGDQNESSVKVYSNLLRGTAGLLRASAGSEAMSKQVVEDESQFNTNNQNDTGNSNPVSESASNSVKDSSNVSDKSEIDVWNQLFSEKSNSNLRNQPAKEIGANEVKEVLASKNTSNPSNSGVIEEKDVNKLLSSLGIKSTPDSNDDDQNNDEVYDVADEASPAAVPSTALSGLSGLPDFAANLIRNVEKSDDHDDSEDDEDEDDSISEKEQAKAIQNLLQQTMSQTIVNESSEEAVANCTIIMNSNKDPKESTKSVTNRVSDALVEYPTEPTPTYPTGSSINVVKIISNMRKKSID